MATVAATTPKSNKAFRAELYETSGALSKVGGTIYFFADSGAITEFEPDMATFCTVLGEVGLAETQALMDRLHGGAVGVCLSRAQEVA